MKKVMKLALAVALLMGATSLYAQQKFGRINKQEIVMLMPEMKEMQTNMEAYGKDLQDNMEAIGVEFNTKYQDYQKNYNTMSEAVRQLKEKELSELQNRRQEFEQAAQQDYQKRQNELLTPIIDKAEEAIDKVAKTAGYTVVFDTSAMSLAYFDETALPDLAAEVKKALNITETPAAAKPAAAPAAKK